MTAPEKIIYKTKLKQHCIAVIEQRVANSQHAMQGAQDAANEEEKSSAGDKYETARAMSHLQKDMHAKQLEANRQDLAAVAAINCEILYDAVHPGSVVICEDASFFIAAGLGKISFEGKELYLLSPQAPVAALLFNKKKGDSILFNNRTFLISDLF